MICTSSSDLWVDLSRDGGLGGADSLKRKSRTFIPFGGLGISLLEGVEVELAADLPFVGAAEELFACAEVDPCKAELVPRGAGAVPGGAGVVPGGAEVVEVAVCAGLELEVVGVELDCVGFALDADCAGLDEVGVLPEFRDLRGEGGTELIGTDDSLGAKTFGVDVCVEELTLGAEFSEEIDKSFMLRFSLEVCELLDCKRISPKILTSSCTCDCWSILLSGTLFLKMFKSLADRIFSRSTPLKRGKGLQRTYGATSISETSSAVVGPPSF